MNLRKANMKYGRLVRYGLTLVIGALKIMASTGIFGLFVCVLNSVLNGFPSPLSTILL